MTVIVRDSDLVEIFDPPFFDPIVRAVVVLEVAVIGEPSSAAPALTEDCWKACHQSAPHLTRNDASHRGSSSAMLEPWK